MRTFGFDPSTSEFRRDPFHTYERGRRDYPISYNPAREAWSAFRYADCLAILRDHDTWSAVRQPELQTEGGPRSMLTSDPPDHTRLRSLVNQAFSARVTASLEPRVRAVTDGLLDAVAREGECDLVEALTYPLPVIMIAEIIGVPPEDRPAFKRWSDVVVARLGQRAAPLSSEEAQAMDPEGFAVIAEMGEYFARAAEDRRATPREDLLTGLVEAEHEGERLNFQELISMLVLLLVAGNETTTNLIGNMVIQLVAHPEQFERVRRDPALIPSAVEEVLRFDSPVQGTARRALREVELGGERIPAGALVNTWLQSANRDEEQFPDASTFDVGRSPNRHLAFGQGIHFCLGAPLSRLEARVALEAIVERMPNLRRANERDLPRQASFIMRGVTELPVRFDPAPVATA